MATREGRWGTWSVGGPPAASSTSVSSDAATRIVHMRTVLAQQGEGKGGGGGSSPGRVGGVRVPQTPSTGRRGDPFLSWYLSAEPLASTTPRRLSSMSGRKATHLTGPMCLHASSPPFI